MRTKVTKEWLESHEPCGDGFEYWIEQKKPDLFEFTRQCIKDDHCNWANWLMVRCMDRKQYLRYALYAVKQVEPLYRKQCPDSKAVTDVIKAVKACIIDDSEVNRAFAYASYHAAYACYVSYVSYGAVVDYADYIAAYNAKSASDAGKAANAVRAASSSSAADAAASSSAYAAKAAKSASDAAKAAKAFRAASSSSSADAAASSTAYDVINADGAVVYKEEHKAMLTKFIKYGMRIMKEKQIIRC